MIQQLLSYIEFIDFFKVGKHQWHSLTIKKVKGSMCTMQ